MNNDKNTYLNMRRHGNQAQWNTNVKPSRQRAVVDAFKYLLRKLSPENKSGITCDAVILFAWVLREGLLSDEQIRAILDQG